MQASLTYTQLNAGTPEEVFPLLCPVREKDWLEGWDFEMIHSQSGINELDCVFVTGHHGPAETVWITTEYDSKNYRVGFARVTPGVMAVRISIHLKSADEGKSFAHITYIYTALSLEGEAYIKHDLEQDFSDSMKAWESAINHYLKTGEMKRSQISREG